MCVLGTILLILKLAEVIQWPWWIVLIPFYGLFLVLFVFIIYFFIGMLIGLKEWYDSKGNVIDSVGATEVQ
jgi:MFS superfamily sulfate permease-like transporter